MAVLPTQHGRRFTRLRRLAAGGVLAGLLVSVAPAGALAASQGTVIGPWTCPPDTTVTLEVHVTGAAGSGSVIIEPLEYKDTYGDTIFWHQTVYPGGNGWTYIHPPKVGRTIYWFQWTNQGKAAYSQAARDCN